MLFQYLSDYVRTSYLNEASYVLLRKKDEEQHRALSQMLFGEHPQVTPEIRSLLARFGWREEHRYRVVVFTEICKSHSALDTSFLRHKLENDWQETYLLPAGSRFVWVINDTLSKDDASRHLRDYFARFVREHMLKAGISDCRTGLDSINTLYSQACASLAIGQRKRPHMWMFAFEDYLLDYILDKFCCEFPADQTIHRGLMRLIAYDQNNATDYVETLRCYIDNQFNASISAEKVYVHRSTFLRRIERIEELSGIKLQQPDELLHVMISLKLCDHLGYIQGKSVS